MTVLLLQAGLNFLDPLLRAGRFLGVEIVRSAACFELQVERARFLVTAVAFDLPCRVYLRRRMHDHRSSSRVLVLFVVALARPIVLQPALRETKKKKQCIIVQWCVGLYTQMPPYLYTPCSYNHPLYRSTAADVCASPARTNAASSSLRLRRVCRGSCKEGWQQ